jgi:hypothetical protein
MTSKLMSERSVPHVVEKAGLNVEIVRLEIAVGRRLGIEAVVRQDDGLRVLQLSEHLRFEDVLTHEAVTFRSADRSPVGGRSRG